MYNYLIIFCFTLFYTSVFYPRKFGETRGKGFFEGAVRAFRCRTLPSAACRLAVEAGRSAAVRGRAGVRVQRGRRLCGPPA